jgi:hypothetical protein
MSEEVKSIDFPYDAFFNNFIFNSDSINIPIPGLSEVEDWNRDTV